MTIKQKQYLQNVSQQNKIGVGVLKCEKEKLFEAAQDELLLVEGRRRKKPWIATAQEWNTSTILANGSQTAELYPNEGVCGSEGNLNEGKNCEGGNDLLLILANSAELMSESEYSLHTVDVNPQDHEELHSIAVAPQLDENVNDDMATDNGKNQDKVNEIPLIAHERNQKDGFDCEGKLPRLSQIRRQARLKSQSYMQQSIQEDTCMCSQGSKSRLTQIRRQARLGNHVPVREAYNIAGCSHGQLLSGITRLSQIRRQARSKSNCSQQEGHRHLDCQFHEDHQIKEDAAAGQCPKLDSYQVIGALSSCSAHAKSTDKFMCEKGRQTMLKPIKTQSSFGKFRFGCTEKCLSTG